MDNNELITWSRLQLYTREIKEWVEKLFRKAHARMGHIEEDVVKVARSAKHDYRLESTVTDDNNIDVTLYESVSGTYHGNFTISSTGTVDINKWEEAGTPQFPRSE